jgi:hypothetical protein
MENKEWQSTVDGVKFVIDDDGEWGTVSQVPLDEMDLGTIHKELEFLEDNMDKAFADLQEWKSSIEGVKLIFAKDEWCAMFPSRPIDSVEIFMLLGELRFLDKNVGHQKN